MKRTLVKSENSFDWRVIEVQRVQLKNVKNHQNSNCIIAYLYAHIDFLSIFINAPIIYLFN